MIFQGFRPARSIKIIPVVKGGPGNAELFQRAPDRQMRLLDQPDDLELLGCGIPHSPPPPSAIMLYGMARPFCRRVSSPVTQLEEKTMQIAVLGIDIGKNSCSIAGLDASGRIVLRR